MADVWGEEGAYERYMGRWSRLLAREFVRWLDAPAGLRWVDVGCGTGALTTAVLDLVAPASVLGVEPSAGFLEAARRSVDDTRASFRLGSVERLDPASADVVVAGLALNFMPDADSAVAAFVRAAAPGGTVAAYVWDYAAGMEMLMRFWDVAERVAGEPLGQSEFSRFELCRPELLTAVWERAGAHDVTTGTVGIEMAFTGFDDFWMPFLGGQGPAPAYVAALEAAHRERLREALEAELRPGADGVIRLGARAWAVRGETG